jgi:hypothetical protein
MSESSIKVNCVFLQRGLGWGSRRTIKKRDLEDKKKAVRGQPLVFTDSGNKKGKMTID